MNHLLRGRCSAVLVAALIAAPVAAQSVVVPNANTTTSGGLSLNSLFRDAPNARTVQQLVRASELSGIPTGAYLVGISLRASITTSNPATWPATPATFNNYDITLAQSAVSTSTLTSNFAANMQNPVQVRSGPWTIPANHYVNNGSPGPNPFDRLYFEFQKPYQYQGGDLIIHATHDGQAAGAAIFADCVTSNTSTYGELLYATSYQATTATNNSNFNVMRIHYGVGPAGLAGANGNSPRLVLSSNLAPPTPVPGTAHFAVVSAAPNVGGALIVGPGILPTPFGLPNGANLLVSPPFQVVPIAIGPNGRFDLTLAFPANIVGRFGVQAAVFDPGASGGAVATNAVLFQLSP